MAVKIDLKSPFGAPQTYAKLKSAFVYYDESCVDAYFSLYYDEAARRGNKSAEEMTVRLSFAEIGNEEPDRASIYRAAITKVAQLAGDAV